MNEGRVKDLAEKLRKGETTTEDMQKELRKRELVHKSNMTKIGVSINQRLSIC